MRTPPRVMPALITPFTRTGALDLDLHASNVAEMGRRGITGLLIGGSTGQGPYLEPGERRDLIATARDTSPAAFILAGVVAETLRTALAQADEAASAGADATLVITPTTLVRNRDHLVTSFFSDLAERAALPILLYSVPGVTGYVLPVAAITELAAHPNVIGMKDSGGDPVRAGEIVSVAPDGFVLYVGASRAVALTMAAGAHGAITASTNYAAAIVGRIVGARSHPSTAEPQAALNRLIRVVEPHGIPGTNAAAQLAGLGAGTPRRPLRPVSPAVRSQIAAALDAAGLVAD